MYKIPSEIKREIYTAINWALFNLGAGQLILVVTKNTLYFLLVALLASIFFVIQIAYLSLEKNTFKILVRSLFIGISIQVLLKFIFNNFVVLDYSKNGLILDFISLVVFLFFGLLIGFFLIQRSYAKR